MECYTSDVWKYSSTEEPGGADERVDMGATATAPTPAVVHLLRLQEIHVGPRVKWENQQLHPSVSLKSLAPLSAVVLANTRFPRAILTIFPVWFILNRT